MEALQDAAFKIDPEAIIRFTGTDCIRILHRRHSHIDQMLSISFRLYGAHNSMDISSEDGWLVLHGDTYHLLPEFLIKGEEVEF